MSLHRITQNAIALVVIQMANYAVPLVVLLYLTKTLGVTLYGVLAFAQGIVSLSSVVVDLGYSLSATAKISKHRERKDYVGKILTSLLLIKVGLILLVAIPLVSYAFLTEQYAAHKAVFILSILPVLGQGLTPVWFFQGIERMRLIAVFSITAKLLYAALVLVLVSAPEDYIWVPALNGASQLAAFGISIYLIYRVGYRFRAPSRRLVVYCLKFTQPFFLSRIAVASYMSSATVVLGLTSRPEVVAIYAMAEQIYKAMQSAIYPISAAAYPYMAKERNAGLMFRLIFGVVVAVAVGAVAAYFLIPIVIPMIFNQEWSSAIPVLNVFLAALIIHAGAVMMGYPLAAAVGRIEVANGSVIGGSAVYLVLMLVSYPLRVLNPVTLAVIMMISEAYVLGHRALFLVPAAISQHKKSHTSSLLL